MTFLDGRRPLYLVVNRDEEVKGALFETVGRRQTMSGHVYKASMIKVRCQLL
jgi:hypothetical protein